MGILREQKMGERLVVDMFPYPPEVTGVSYFDLSGINDQTLLNVSVPFQGGWGFLQLLAENTTIIGS